MFTFAVIRKLCEILHSFPITEPVWVQIQTKVLVPQKDVLLSFVAEAIA